MKLLYQFNIPLEVVSAIIGHYSDDTRWLCDSYLEAPLLFLEDINWSLVLSLGYLNEIND